MTTTNLLAFDLNGTNQDISGGDDWTIIKGTVIPRWNEEFLGQASDETGQFQIGLSGFYLHDPVFEFRDLVNVASVAVGLFMDGDCYFALEEHLADGQTSVQVRDAYMVDIPDWRVCDVRVKLTKSDPELDCSGTVYGGSFTRAPGDDSGDLTAWGFTLMKAAEMPQPEEE
jgi:hypothetical protein